MIKNVKKRDGRSRVFNAEKIVNAINYAFKESKECIENERLDHIIERTLEEVEKLGKKTVQSAAIEKIIKELLMNHGYHQTAEAYILFSAEKQRVRETNSELFKTIREIGAADLKNSSLLRDNGNVNGATVASSYAKAGGEAWKTYNLMTHIKPANRIAHLNGDLHIHDLDYYSLTMNCLFIPLADLLKRGFDTGNGYIRPPHSIGSAGALAAILIQSSQNQMFGGQAFAHLDDDLAPYVNESFKKHLKAEVKAWRKYANVSDQTIEAHTVNDKNLDINDPIQLWHLPELVVKEAILKTDKETYQAMEALVHNLNSLFSRSGNQLPFSSVNFGLNTTRAGRMVSQNLLKATEAGMGDGSTAIFPISICKMMMGINVDPSDPNYDIWEKSCEICAKRFYPNFVNADASYNKPGIRYDEKVIEWNKDIIWKRIGTDELLSCLPDDVADYEGDHSLATEEIGKAETKIGSLWYTLTAVNGRNFTVKRILPESVIATMGCRTRSYEDVNGVTQTDAKGNLWFTTINLPAIAIRAKKAKDPIEAFFTELQQRCEQCRDIMEDRYELIAKRHYENFPFLMQQGVYMDSDPANHKPEDEIREVLKHGSNAIGYIGIYEVCKLLLNKTLGVDQEAFDLGYRIVKHIRDYTDKVKKETHQNWSCFATPAENVCGRFAELDKKRYGEIPDITDKGYYTNSHMLPFDLKTTLANKLKNEAPFHKLSNGGHIFYHKLDGNPAMNVEAVKKAIRAMYDADLGYFTITFDQDRCRKCGHIGIIADECPNCGAKDDGVNILRIRRITGYLVGRPGQSIEKSWGTGKQNELKKRVNI